MNDRSFVGGDCVGSMIERGADVVNRWLTVFYIERGGFEEDVGLGGFQPGLYIGGSRRDIGNTRSSWWEFAGGGASATWIEIYTICIRNPSQPPRSNSRDAKGDCISLAQFGSPVLEQPRKRAIDVAETEKAEIERAYGEVLEPPRLKPEVPYPITVQCSGLIL
jgi:hypothetical protein